MDANNYISSSSWFLYVWARLWFIDMNLVFWWNIFHASRRILSLKCIFYQVIWNAQWAHSSKAIFNKILYERQFIYKPRGSVSILARSVQVQNETSFEFSSIQRHILRVWNTKYKIQNTVSSRQIGLSICIPCWILSRKTDTIWCDIASILTQHMPFADNKIYAQFMWHCSVAWVAVYCAFASTASDKRNIDSESRSAQTECYIFKVRFTSSLAPDVCMQSVTDANTSDALHSKWMQ